MVAPGVERRLRTSQTQTLSFQGNGATTGKGVVKSRKLVRVKAGLALVQLAGFPPGLSDFFPRLLQNFLVSGVLPLDQLADQGEQPLPFLLGVFLGLPRISAPTAISARIVHQLGKQHAPRRRQRPPRPPQVQRGRMAVPDGFLPGGRGIDVIQGKATSMSFLGALIMILFSGCP